MAFPVLRLGLATITLATGCDEFGEPGDDPSGDTGAEIGPDDPAPSQDPCPGETDIAFEATVNGSTTDSGWDFDLADWADNSNVACYPNTSMADLYRGPYQMYTIDIPPQSDWDVVATPEAGVDVSLVVWQQGDGDTACSPLLGVGVVTCEASGNGGEGEEERVRLNATTSGYRLVIAVTTPSGGTAGNYSLQVRTHE